MLSGQTLENVNLIEASIKVIEDKLVKTESRTSENSCDCNCNCN